jgi:hypothetical protein
MKKVNPLLLPRFTTTFFFGQGIVFIVIRKKDESLAYNNVPSLMGFEYAQKLSMHAEFGRLCNSRKMSVLAFNRYSV